MQNSYQRKILVTGGAGFIGSSYLNIYVKKYPQYFFINLDALTYAGTLDNLEISKEKNYVFKKADIRNLSGLERIFKKYQPTDIIHFAAESHVDVSIKNPNIFVETNIAGTHNLLLLAQKYKINRFYQISTDEVYGSLGKNDPSFTEDSPLLPNSPYSASKAGADLLVRSYHKTYGLDVVTSRCSNNFGPRQDSTKLIPKFIINLLQNKRVPLYSTGSNVRDWIYVDDHATAIDAIFHHGKSGEIYNVGGSCEKTNLQITKALLAALGKSDKLIQYVADRPGHDFRYALDSSKLQRELGWKPRYTFEEGLHKTIDWFKQNYTAR